MSARDDLRRYVRLLADAWTPPAKTEERVDRVYRAIRSEVLRETAQKVGAEASSIHLVEVQEALGLFRAEQLLRGMADEAGTDASGSKPDQTAGFFQPGRTYTYGQTGYRAPELTRLFRVEHVTRHPDRGNLRAIGWMRSGEPDAKWHGHFRDEFDGWTETANDGADGAEKDTADGEPAELVIYRASHDSIVMGLYTTRQAAYEHCEAHELRDDPVSPMAWNVDEDGVAELVRLRVPRSPGAESATGYVVTPLTVASAHDEEADE
jgi:hypothetical protein